MNRALFSVDLFSGAGGLTEGFRQAGFEPLAANDFDSEAARTFRHNFPKTPFISGPIGEITDRHFRETAGIRAGELDVLLGGPPCQAFSVYNHQRGFHDERSGLFREYLRIVGAFLPKMVVMENVTGMFSLDRGRAVDEIHTRLEKLGYIVEHRVLRSEDYGVPQERRRIFFIASRVGPIVWPRITHGDPRELLSVNLNPFVTVANAIGDLPMLRMGEGTDATRPYTRTTKCDYQRMMREGSEGVANHYAPQLADINVERLKHIPPGGSWRDLPHHLLPMGMKRARRSDHTKRYGRLTRNGLFSTILTKADLHWGAYIHPEQDRTLTVRECARAQSFPDSFVFLGSRVEQYKQVGNAVPPLLGRAVAESVQEALALADNTKVKNFAAA